MTLMMPFWLILFLPFAVLFLKRKAPSRILGVLGGVCVALVIFSLCRPAIRLPSREGTVVVVADRSLSMPDGSLDALVESVRLVRDGMKGDDLLGVVAFGEKTMVERSPQQGDFTGFLQEPGSDRSDLSTALQTALSMIPEGSPGRILVLSDGKWTGDDPAEASALAAGRSIPVDYREYRRAESGDISVARFDLPDNVEPGEAFVVGAQIDSPSDTDAAFTLYRNGSPISSGKRALSEGRQLLLFRDMAQKPGAIRYSLTINGAGNDPIPENNTAKGFVGVEGMKPLLLVSGQKHSGLAKLLKKSDVDIVTIAPESCRWSLEELTGYSGLVLENLPADAIGVSGLANIAAWVSETGTGIMITGGKNAYGPGGYFRSPLEPILPVSMELRREHRKLAIAIVIVLDRSGSMAMDAGGGRTKMDLANMGAAQVLDLMSPPDGLGVIAVDSTPHIIVDLDSVEHADTMRRKILRIDSQGGGIFVYSGLLAAAGILQKANVATRHVILFADAADAEEPGEYKELLEKCANANITVSVIGLGTAADSDAEFLKDVAARGNGRIFFTNRVQEIPRLFAQDTFIALRNAFVENATPVKKTAALLHLTDKNFGEIPSIGGYNLCYVRPDANPAIVTRDEYAAPVLAFWQAGRGRALCYTGEADGEFTGNIAGWAQANIFFSSLARWTAGDTRTLPEGLRVTKEMQRGNVVVQLHLDPERQGDPFEKSPKVGVLRSVRGGTPVSQTLEMEWTSPDLMSVQIPIYGSETVVPVVDTGIPGIGPIALSPACLPYSPEFAPAQTFFGTSLGDLAKATGGKERIDLKGIWNELPEKTALVEIGRWLMLVALTLFLMETLQRRTGVLTVKTRRIPTVITKPARATPEKGVAKRKPIKEKTRKTPETVETQPDTDQALNAMNLAKKKAESRMKR